MRTSEPVSPRSRKRGFGPGRNRLLQAQQARGRSTFNLWYHYSSRLARDVIVRSDVEFAHFCWLEGDPNILRYELEPSPVIVAVGSQLQRTQFDALVEFHRGRAQLREVKTSEAQLSARELSQRQAQQQHAEAAGFEYLRVTWESLAPHAQLIRNWRCALAFLTACREIVLTPQREEIKRVLLAERRITLGGVLGHFDPAHRPTYVAALLRCLQAGDFLSDLDSNPLCDHSLLWLQEARRV
jgi:hypothetical protein